MAIATETGPFPNHTLYDPAFIKPTGTVFEWIRNMVANAMAGSAPEWAAIYAAYPSATYNNQWLIVDYNVFVPGAPALAKDTMWVVEQVGPLMEARDMTATLAAAGYIPSYNMPSFDELYNVTGWAAYAAKWGSYFTYHDRFRSHIFARDAPSVGSLDALRALMRYNDFQHDPLAHCDGCVTPAYTAIGAVAARADLNDPNATFPFADIAFQCFGGFDSKVTSSALFRARAGHIIQSPSYDQQPVFDWATSPCASADLGLPHEGQPSRWQFPWQTAAFTA